MRTALDAGGPSLLWTCLIAFALSRSCAGVCTFISNTIILNGLLSDASNVGFYNGLNDSLSALGRGVAPVITGTMFAAMTTSEAFFPFDEHLPFYFVSFLAVVGLPGCWNGLVLVVWPPATPSSPSGKPWRAWREGGFVMRAAASRSPEDLLGY